jgi:hypothetical protein
VGTASRVLALAGGEQTLGQPGPPRECALEAIYLEQVDPKADHTHRYSTVTVFARLRGWSTFRSRRRAMW